MKTCGTCRPCCNAKCRSYQRENETAVKRASLEYRQANRRKIADKEITRYHANKPEIRQKQRQYYLKNTEKFSERGRAWRDANVEAVRDYNKKNADKIREKNIRWRNDNRQKWRAIMAECVRRRKMREVRATPRWADISAIQDIYIQCQIISDETGTKHHVDHIVPLVHPLVCGLHVHWNLQILTAYDNLSKSNKFEG